MRAPSASPEAAMKKVRRLQPMRFPPVRPHATTRRDEMTVPRRYPIRVTQTTCDLLLTNAVVLTMDPQFTVYRASAVAVTGDSIVAVGPGALSYQAAETIDCGGRVVMPGLVNAHTHGPMALLRGLAHDLRLDVWLMGYMMPTERQFVTPEFCRLGTGLACAEMIRSGITSFADMYYFEADVAAATAAACLRCVLGQ